MSKSLSFAALTKKNENGPTPIPANEIKLGAVFYVMYPAADDRDLLELQWTNYQKAFGLEGNVGFRKFLVAWALCDEEGNRMLDPGTEENRVTPEFIKAMNDLGENMPLNVIARAFDKAAHLFGFSTGDLEQLEKNSGTTSPDDGSGDKPKQSGSAGKGGSGDSKTPAKSRSSKRSTK